MSRGRSDVTTQVDGHKSIGEFRPNTSEHPENYAASDAPRRHTQLLQCAPPHSREAVTYAQEVTLPPPPLDDNEYSSSQQIRTVQVHILYWHNS